MLSENWWLVVTGVGLGIFAPSAYYLLVALFTH